MSEFCLMRGCPEFAIPQSQFCERHRNERLAYGAAMTPGELARMTAEKKRGQQMQLLWVTCSECGTDDWIRPGVLSRRCKPKCKACGSIYLIPRRGQQVRALTKVAVNRHTVTHDRRKARRRTPRPRYVEPTPLPSAARAKRVEELRKRVTRHYAELKNGQGEV